MKHIYEYLIGGKKMGREKTAETFGELKKGSVIYVYTFDGSWSNLNESEGVITDVDEMHEALTFTSTLSEGILDSSKPKLLSFMMNKTMFGKDIYVLNQYLRFYRYIVISLCKLDVANSKENKRKYGTIVQ